MSAPLFVRYSNVICEVKAYIRYAVCKTASSLEMMYSKILVIDDDIDDQEIFLTALETASSSVECTTSASGVDALQKLTEGTITTDIIFLDLNMPIMSGQEFLSEIKRDKHLANIPVIVLSTSAHQPTIEQAKRLGAANFITKPDKFNELVRILKEILN